uniref:Uncharacterized protein n=1 Tax=Octopus bimaculoides TaxID=37653 RepID=A0A0L8GG45_OCTBM
MEIYCPKCSLLQRMVFLQVNFKSLAALYWVPGP